MKQLIKNSIVGFLLIISGVVRGQETFHNIYFFDDSVAVISDIFPTDSGYYFCGRTLNGFNLKTEAIFGRIDLNGALIFFSKNIDITSNQLVSRANIQPDINNNLTFMSRNAGTFNVPRIMKYSTEGIEVADTLYSNLWSLDSLIFYDFGRLFTNNSDTSHYIFTTYYDELTDDDNQSSVSYPGEFGVFLGKVKQNGNFIWKKRFANPATANFKPSYSSMSMCVLSDTTLFLSMRERKQNPPFQEFQDWAKIHFFVIDTAGNELEHHAFQDTQFNYGQFGLLKTDSSVIYSNLVSEFSSWPPSSLPDWHYRSVLTCLDQNYQLKWKDTLIPDFVVPFNYESPQKLIQTSDTSFAGAYTRADGYINEDTTVYWVLFPVRLFNKSLETGEDIWKRNFRYFPEDSMRRYEHEIIDIEQTYDGGYIMCGSVTSADSLQANRPAQYGYVIKTNCLGFLGDPEVAASYNFGEENTVLFHNESIQAGSFLWDFGDGTILVTGEDTNAVSHEYSVTGVYTIQLIGYGCDGKTDTVSFTIDFEYTEPGYAGDGTLLTLYPNPISTGNSLAFYVGNIPAGTHYVNVSNNLGQRVDRFRIEAGNTNYLFPLDYAAGMYHFTLQNESKVLEYEKLIVE